MQDVKFYNRVGSVWIVGRNNETIRRLFGVDFKFHVEKFVGGIKDKGSVSILGLNSDDVNFFSTFCNPAEMIQKQYRVRVYAGYQDTGEQLIIDGDIMKAVPSMPPDNWLRMEIMCNFYKNMKMFDKSENADIEKTIGAGTMSVRNVIEKFCKYAGFTPKFNLSDESEMKKKVSSFNASGTVADIIREINFLGKFNVRMEGDTLIISDDSWDEGNMHNVILNEGSGMVGVPQFQWPFVDITARINSYIRIMDSVILQSKLCPSANGSFTVFSLTYDGHLRGEPWYVKIHARSNKSGKGK